MNLKPWILFPLILLSVSTQATEVVWLRLTPLFSYKDITLACSNFIKPIHTPRDLFFAAEVNGITVQRAALRDSTSQMFAESISFLSSELVGIALTRDGKERLWLKALPKSARLLNWVFFRTTYTPDGCKPPLPLKTLEPAAFIFTFNPEELGGMPGSIDSQTGTFRGQRQDGYAYEASLRLTQRQLNSESEGVR